MKITALVLLISLVFCLAGCNINPDGVENNQNNGEAEETDWLAEYPWNGKKNLVLDSYAELMSAWTVINRSVGEARDNYYILPDEVGEGFTVVYSLRAENCIHNMEKPIVSTGVQLFLPDTSRDMCPHTAEDLDYYAHSAVVSPIDSNRKSYIIEDLLSIQILTLRYVEITDRALISIEKSTNGGRPGMTVSNMFIFDQPICYDVFYGETRVACLRSCIELDASVLELVAGNLCGLYDLQ